MRHEEVIKRRIEALSKTVKKAIKDSYRVTGLPSFDEINSSLKATLDNLVKKKTIADYKMVRGNELPFAGWKWTVSYKTPASMGGNWVGQEANE